MSRASMSARLREIIGEVEQARAALLVSVEGLSQGQLDHRPELEQWSIGEILHHLQLVEWQVARLLAKQVARASRIGLGPDTGGGSLLHILDQFSLEKAPLKFMAPASATPVRSLAREDLLAGLAGARSELRRALEDADSFDLSQLHFPHPALGPLDMYQWVLFVGKHDTRHRLQIERVKLLLPPS